jgi:hypothetical protein
MLITGLGDSVTVLAVPVCAVGGAAQLTAAVALLKRVSVTVQETVAGFRSAPRLTDTVVTKAPGVVVLGTHAFVTLSGVPTHVTWAVSRAVAIKFPWASILQAVFAAGIVSPAAEP